MDALYVELETLLNQSLGEDGTLFSSGKFEGTGWMYDANHYPRFALKQYGKGVHLYVFGVSELEEKTNTLRTLLGKQGMGKGCIRYRKWSPALRDATRDLIDSCKTK